MAQVIKLKRSAVAGKTPQTSSLQLGELAVNTTDGKIYLHRSSSGDDSIQSVLTTDATITGSLKLSGSQHLSGSLNVMDNLTYGGNLTASLGSTSSFDRITSVGTSSIGFLIASGSNFATFTNQTGSFASGSDVQQILGESGSYLVDTDTGSLGKVTLVSDITGSITSTGSFGKLFGDGGDLTNVADPEAISGSYLGLLSGSNDLTLGLGVSGSLTSTGSFGKLLGDGGDLTNVADPEAISGSYLGLLSGSHDLSLGLGVSGSLTSTASFGKLELIDTVHISPFGSGSDLHQFLAESASYVTSISTGSLNVMLEESSSYVTLDETGSFASGSDLQVILAESSSYVTLDETGSFASGSDIQIILAESASYVTSTNTSSFLQNSDTASLQTVGIHDTLFVSGNITTSGSVIAREFKTELVSSSIIYSSGSNEFGDTIDDTHIFTGSILLTGSLTMDTGSIILEDGDISGSILSNASFGTLELADSHGFVLSTDTGSLASGSDVSQIQALTASYASGSDLHQFLAESASYVVDSDTGSLHQVLAESASYLVKAETASLGKVTLLNDITGSITSTGSFGKIFGDGSDLSNLPESFTSDLISGSFQGGGSTNISGSITSTGSFGSLVSPGLSTLGIVTTSEILNNTGTLKVSQSVSDGDIEISVNDGGTTKKALTIDGSDAGSVILGNNLRMADNQKIRLGTSNDFNLYHDGTHTYVENTTGHILMRNQSHGNKIQFGTENSSGVLEYVLNVTGTHNVGIGTSITGDDKLLVMGDVGVTGSLFVSSSITTQGDILGNISSSASSTSSLGTLNLHNTLSVSSQSGHLNGGPNNIPLLVSRNNSKTSTLALVSTGSAGYANYMQFLTSELNQMGSIGFTLGTNNKFTITSNMQNQDMIFQVQDAANNLREALRIDSSANRVGIYNSSPTKELVVSGAISASGDLFIDDINTTGTFTNTSGTLKVSQSVSDADIEISVNDGGSIITAFKIDASDSAKVRIPNDSQYLAIGAGGDLRFQHNGTNSFIENYTGALFMDNNAEDQDIFIRVNDGGSTTTAIRIDASDNSRVKLANDNQKLSIGASNDIEIFHDGTDSTMLNQTGDLTIKNNANDKDIILQSDDGSGGVTTYLTLDGSVTKTTLQKDISGSLGTTGSFDRLEGITLNASISPFASGSDVSQIQAQTGSYATGSDLHQFLAESASYLVDADTGSLGLLTLGNDITGSITSTASFGDLVVDGRLGIGTKSPTREFNMVSTQQVTSEFASTNAIGNLIDLVHENSANGHNGFRFFDEGTQRMGLLHVQNGTRGYIHISNTYVSGSEIVAVDGDNQNVIIGNHASKDEKLFVDGNVGMTGDLNVSGSITANEYIVNSSVTNVTQSFSSGSTIFGDSIDDTHKFTGSLSVSGGLSFPLSGSTITFDGEGGNTQIAAPSDTQLQLKVKGVQGINIFDSGVVINEGSQDYNFRVETNNDSRTIFADGGRDNVSIGYDTAAFDEKFLVAGNTGITGSLNVSGSITSNQTPNVHSLSGSLHVSGGIGGTLHLSSSTSTPMIQFHQSSSDAAVLLQTDEYGADLWKVIEFSEYNHSGLLIGQTFTTSTQDAIRIRGGGNGDNNVDHYLGQNSYMLTDLGDTTTAYAKIDSSGLTTSGSVTASNGATIGNTETGSFTLSELNVIGTGIGLTLASTNGTAGLIIRDNRASNNSSVVQRSDGRLSLAGTDTLWGSSGIEITSTGRVAVGGTSFGRNDGSLIERFLVHGSAGITGSLHTSGSITTQANISGSITSTGSFGELRLPQTGKLWFDGGSQTYIQESQNDVLDFYVGGQHMLRMEESGEDIVFVNDNKFLALGTGKDFKMHHNSANTYLRNNTGDLHISQSASDKDIFFSVNDGGTIVEALKIDASDAGTAVFNQDIRLETNATYLHSTDASGNKPRMFGMNSSNNTYIGPIDSYAGGAILYGISANVTDQIFYIGGSEKFKINSSGDIIIQATNKLYFDGGTHTYIREGIDDRLDFIVGSDNLLQLDEANNKVNVPQSRLIVSGSDLWSTGNQGGSTDNVVVLQLGRMIDSPNNPLVRFYSDDNLDMLEYNILRYEGKHRFTRGSAAGGRVNMMTVEGNSKTEFKLWHQSNNVSGGDTTGSAVIYLNASTGSSAQSYINSGGGLSIATGSVVIGGTSATNSKLNVKSEGSSQSTLRIDADDARGASRYALHIVDDDSNSRGSVFVSTTSGPSLIVNGDVTGSIETTASFGRIEADSYSLATLSEVSGGIDSTGSFGRLDAHSDGIGSATLLHLDNYVGSDLAQHQSYIDFSLRDSNDNHTPQVRIGAEVGQNGDANTQQKEGSGAFIVFTTNASGTSTNLTELTEKFRVDYLGDVHIKSGSMNISGSILPTTDNQVDIGSSSKRFNDVFAVQTTVGAVFETGLRSKGIGKEETGTIVVWRNGKLVPCDKSEDTMVMGVVKQGKDEPIVMGAEPVLVTGDVKEGDFITTSTKLGHGKKLENGYLLRKEMFGKVIAQALENASGNSSLIKCMIRKM